MGGTINIVVAIDVIAALSNRTLEGSLHMMDDGPLLGANQGTCHLTTFCWPGWVINWTIQPLDLQTPAVIKGIRFVGGTGGGGWAASVGAGALVWSGIVPCWLLPGYQYRYAVEVEMARGKNSLLAIDTPSLEVPPASWIA